MWHIYEYSTPTYTHHVFCICSIYAQFDGCICFWHIFGKEIRSRCCVYAHMLGLFAHIACWLCDVYLQRGSHITLVIYFKYVCSGPCHIIDAIELIYSIYMYIHPLYIFVLGLYAHLV